MPTTKSAQQPSNGNGVASLVLGIISIAVPLFFIPIVAGILGLVFATKQRKLHPTGTATAGMVTSIIGLALWGVLFLVLLFFVGTAVLFASIVAMTVP